jgi:Zn-dependent oligopeptidase
MNTKSLQPPNSILQSVREVRSALVAADHQSPVVLPRFSNMLPYHLEPAALEVTRQYNVELAKLEVSLTKSISSLSEPEARTVQSAASILEALDRIEAPIHQVLQIGWLMSRLSDEWEDSKAWQLAYAKVQMHFLDQMEFKDSNIVYKALLRASTANTMSRPSQSLLPSRLLQSFRKRGSHLVRPALEDDQDDEDENDARGDDIDESTSFSTTAASTTTASPTPTQLQEIQQQISLLRHRILSTSAAFSMNFMIMPRSVQLSIVSDLYNTIGLTQQQAKLLGYTNACAMELDNLSHSLTASEIRQFHQDVYDLVQPTMAPHVAQLDEDIFEGAFLGTKNPALQKQQQQPNGGSSNQDKALWQARQSVKRLLTLDGVLRGLFDLTQALLGITIVEENDSSFTRSHAWERDVRLFHVYDTASVPPTPNTDTGVTTTAATPDPSSLVLLGSFYMDSYQRANKSMTPDTWLFTQRSHQTMAPVAIVSLFLERPWDDDPTPLTWDMTRAVLYNYGKALQLILSHTTATTSTSQGGAPKRAGTRMTRPPMDVSEFLAHVSCISCFLVCLRFSTLHFGTHTPCSHMLLLDSHFVWSYPFAPTNNTRPWWMVGTLQKIEWLPNTVYGTVASK